MRCECGLDHRLSSMISCRASRDRRSDVAGKLGAAFSRSCEKRKGRLGPVVYATRIRIDFQTLSSYAPSRKRKTFPYRTIYEQTPPPAEPGLQSSAGAQTKPTMIRLRDCDRLSIVI